MGKTGMSRKKERTQAMNTWALSLMGSGIFLIIAIALFNKFYDAGEYTIVYMAYEAYIAMVAMGMIGVSIVLFIINSLSK
jgi:hypothetical protein